ncbi:hypothetical protein HI914_02702 [Erysiphe necator]|uniref:Mitochondrial carrier protein pet8 protein n=1 Tax=Uncinula necator TaxID=52586 RepID=A0A0B1PAN5_UNCNE|nr:hypothetical protein HI914_02702 [Erysiphe necator]KHJ33724.1 hypothetical protein EV44_g3281 [Erysiphe necator]
MSSPYLITKSSKLFLTRYIPKTHRSLTTSSLRFLKESVRDTPGQASEYEIHKQDALKKQKEGKGHWKAELASDSEEAIAAERTQQDESLHELQKRTASHAEDKHR